MNDLARHLALFDGFEPFSGFVPEGYLVDFLGCRTDAKFRAMWGVDPAVGGEFTTTSLPQVSWGEGFFETADWFAAALEARDRFVMVTLGACYGAQAVGAFIALQRLNPLPAKLVAVEAEPENFEWIKKHFRDNGIDPDEHWLINAAISDSNKPVLFPIGAPGSGAGNCVSTNEAFSRHVYGLELKQAPNLPDIVYELIVNGKTGIQKDLVPGYDFKSDIEFVSAITLPDVLGPFDRVDLLECDIQQSESIVFPPAMAPVKRKVKRVHMGTHGKDVHAQMLSLFRDAGFEIVIAYEPNSHYETLLGSFDTSDGVISAVNPTL